MKWLYETIFLIIALGGALIAGTFIIVILSCIEEVTSFKEQSNAKNNHSKGSGEVDHA